MGCHALLQVEIQTQPIYISWNSILWLLSGILKNKKKIQELVFSFLCSCNVIILPGLSGTTDSTVVSQTEGGKGHFKFRWENYEISGSVEIYLSSLNLWL